MMGEGAYAGGWAATFTQTSGDQYLMLMRSVNGIVVLDGLPYETTRQLIESTMKDDE